MAPKTLIFALAASVMTLAACDGDGADTIGPRGGVVTSPDGRFVLDVPEGALNRDVFITIGQVDDCADDLDVCYEIEPFATMLRVPAAVTYHYEIADLTRGVEQDLAIIAERRDGWSRLADREVDADAATVMGTIMSFSSYTISVGF